MKDAIKFRPLGEVVEIASGQVNPTHTPFSQMPHIGGENIESRTGRIINVQTAAELGLTSGKYLFSESCVLYSKIRPNLNKVATPDFSGICSADIYPINPNLTQIDKRYLAYVLRSKDFLRFAESHSSRTNIPKINRSALLSYEVALPPLSEQKRIADILDKADAIRRKRQEAARLLSSCVPSLFSDMFGFVVKNTKRWPEVAFGDACESRLGKMLDSKQQTGKHLRPYLRNTNVQWNRFNLDEVLEMDFDENDRKEFCLRNGDVLVCEGGEVGRAAIWRQNLPECYFQKALHRVRPNPNLATPEYVLHFLWQMGQHGGFSFLTSQATIAHLTGVKLKQIRLPLPPIELQREFANLLSEIENQNSKHCEADFQANNLFYSLVQRAFKGEL